MAIAGRTSITGWSTPAKQLPAPLGIQRASTVPSLATCKRDGPYSSATQKVPSAAAANPSVSAPIGSGETADPSSANAGSLKMPGVGAPDNGLPARSRRGNDRTMETWSPSIRSSLIDGPISSRGMILAPSSFANGLRSVSPYRSTAKSILRLGPRSPIAQIVSWGSPFRRASPEPRPRVICNMP